MGWFSRGSGEPAPIMDVVFPFLTAAEAARFEGLAADAFHHGYGPVLGVESGTVHSADGRQWGLHNIATECRRQPEAEWPEMLARHVRIIGAMDTAGDGDDA